MNALKQQTQVYFGGFIMTAEDDGQLQQVIGEIAALVRSLTLLARLLLVLLPLLIRLAQSALVVIDVIEALQYGMTHIDEGWGLFWFKWAWNYEKNIV